MIYLTGDTHADWHRFSTDNFPEGKTLTRDDYIIVIGDFGIWNNSKEQQHNLNCLAEKSFTILFVDGNHENFDILDAMPIEEWHGGTVHFIRPNVIHLCRGQVFDINGFKCFTFGGARSHDIQDGILDPKDIDYKQRKKELDRCYGMYRIRGVSWWRQEMPNAREMQEGLNNLIKHDWKVDCVFTHCCPTSMLTILDKGSNFFKSDILTDYLEKIRLELTYNHWVFGHYHDNISLEKEKATLIYEQIVKLGTVNI